MTNQIKNSHFHIFIMFTCAMSAFSCRDLNIEDSACLDRPEKGTRFFLFETAGGSTFIAWTNRDSILLKADLELAKPRNDRNLHISGPIFRNALGCDINKEWSWHFSAQDWDLVAVSITTCSGEPEQVEANPFEYYRKSSYCPWSARILREVRATF